MKYLHDLVEESEKLRVDAAILINKARSEFSHLASGLNEEAGHPRVNISNASELQCRMDANFHDPYVKEVRRRIKFGKHGYVRDLCNSVFLPGIFKRIYIEDIAHGTYYHSATSVFSIAPSPKAVLSNKTSRFNEVVLYQGAVLIQAFGQEDGLIGRVAWVGESLDGAATTHMFVRLIANERKLAGYLFAFLSSGPGYSILTKLPYGGSIPHLSAAQVAELPVPLLEEGMMDRIGDNVLQAHRNRDRAIELENEARSLVERAIEEAAR